MKHVLVFIQSDRGYPSINSRFGDNNNEFIEYIREKTELEVIELGNLEEGILYYQWKGYHPDVMKFNLDGLSIMLFTGESWNNYNEPLRGCHIGIYNRYI